MTPALLKQAREAAQAVIDRWETPLWKDAEPTANVIARLREVVSALTAFDSLSDYDKAIHAIAAMLPSDTVCVSQDATGSTFGYTMNPRLAEDEGVWKPTGGFHYMISDVRVPWPISIPPEQDWRKSLRRITRIDGQVVVTKG